MPDGIIIHLRELFLNRVNLRRIGDWLHSVPAGFPQLGTDGISFGDVGVNDSGTVPARVFIETGEPVPEPLPSLFDRTPDSELSYGGLEWGTVPMFHHIPEYPDVVCVESGADSAVAHPSRVDDG